MFCESDRVIKTLGLIVTRITREARGVVSVELRDPDGADLPTWEPGAHIDLRLPSGVTRQYSLCSDPRDLSHYRVGVLRVADGRGGSREVHDTDLVGRRLEVAGPRNHFPLGLDAPEYLLIAGGIGVTPLLAMARELARRGSSWSMVYGGRSRSSMAYLGELTALGGRIDVVPEDERGIPDLMRPLKAAPAGTAVYCCGPEAMLHAVQSLFEEHLAEGELHIERFATARPSTEAVVASSGSDEEIRVTLAASGRVLKVSPDRGILDAVLEVLPKARYSCRQGYCGACEVTVLAGTPDHRDDVLTDEERESGDTMMICVSRAKTSNLTIDL